MAALNDLIRQDMPIATGASATYLYKPAIERKYRFTTRFGEEVLLHRVEDNVIHLPRALCPISTNDNRVDGADVHFPNLATPRPNQVKVFDETVTFLKAGLSGIVCAYTGWGKTVLGYYVAKAIGKKTLVITTKEDIYDAWIEGAHSILGVPKHQIGEIRGDKCEIVGTTFIVAMIHSLSRDGKYPEWIGHDIGLVIYDECHRVPADQFSTVVDMFPAKLRLGLSATVDRADGKELMLYAHIGPVRAETDLEEMVPSILRFRTTWQCPRRLKVNPETGEKSVIRIPHQPGKTAHIEKMLAIDDDRNDLMLDFVAMALKKGRHTCMFSTQLEHLDTLLKRATKRHGISQKLIGMYVGEQTKAGKEKRDRDKVLPFLLTTYGMMSTGTNLPWLDTCVLGMPRSDVRQTVGRVRRVYDGKRDPVVADFLDLDSPVFAGYAASRLKWYKSIGATTREMD